MDRKKIFVYHKEKFDDFYEELSEKYNIISISSLLNISSQFEEDYLNDEELLVDITTMLKLVVAREDITMFYEVIISHLYRLGNVDIVVEHSYADRAFEIFPQYFSGKEYLTERESNDNDGNEENILNEKTTSIKNITVYNKNNFDEFLNRKKIDDVQVLSIIKVIKKTNYIDYTVDKSKLDDNEKYIFDITAMVKMVNMRSDLLLSFEIILSELSKLANVDFIVDMDDKENCKQLFKYSFHEYIKLPSVGDNNMETKEIKVVDMSKGEIDKFLDKFDEELFGHSDFKEDFKKQIKKYIILNKMKEIKIFSVFLCGDSGIGKTEVARILHRNLYPNSKEIKINFGNYSERGSLWSLIGSPKGYLGSEKGGELTNKIRNSNSKIILIDEFDRADKSIFSFFYELLEDGKFTDLDENEIDLNGYIIIFTSNLNASNYKNVIPEPLFSRLSMRYEFIPLNCEDKQNFVIYRTEHLINEYNEEFNNEFDNTVKNMLLNINISDLNNLRDIDIRLTNKFIELVEV
ncbi:AAA family ATPase [Clostridium estertheticum]|uniref:AAA family ATPase n=1 Tax=Clostridium estertheticum TaxID=238834 RepID=UPI0013E97FAD|nr:AAA family ATPase [Clostridium estertheticum]MBZ9689337.1 AAA family ATPase [Clostridium estertheticum]